MYCTSCGKQIADDAAFCPYCKKPASQDNVLADLVAAARMGDQNAVGALYEKTYSKVYYTVKSMIKDEDAVFDIVQDTYIKAFAHLDSFQGDTKFLPWVRQIAANAGVEGAVVVQKVSEGSGDFGYNARTDTYENLLAAGVIDPAKVTRVALENAASIAGMFLTTECVIAEKKEENPAPMAAPGMGGMGGMM